MIQPFIAAFTGTAVEFLETAAIAYAIVRAGYPREALSALVLGHVLVFSLAVLIVPFQGSLPIFWLRLTAAVLLTSMALHWSLKSLRRIWAHQRPRWVEDPLGKAGVAETASPVAFSLMVFFVMGKSSVVEAIEILIVTLPIAAATSAWNAVIWGVVAGIFVVSLCTWLLHGQLKKIPEVKLKLVIGLVLSVMGMSWLAELYRDYAS